MLTDARWAVMAPAVAWAKRYNGRQRQATPGRVFFEAVPYCTRTRVSWRDLPAEFGAWDAVYNRLRRRVHSGRLPALFEPLTAPRAEGHLPGAARRHHRPRPPARGRRPEKASGRSYRRPPRASAAAVAG